MFESNKLPERLKRYGFEYILVTGESNKALYTQYYEGKKIGYEVLMLKDRHNLSNLHYPKHEDFGKKAWTFRSENAAVDFYNSLTPNNSGQMELPF